MVANLHKKALALPPAERILLAERLWDSLVDSDDAKSLALSAAQRRELEKRLKRIKKDGLTGSDWNTVKTRLRKRAK